MTEQTVETVETKSVDINEVIDHVISTGNRVVISVKNTRVALIPDEEIDLLVAIDEELERDLAENGNEVE